MQSLDRKICDDFQTGAMRGELARIKAVARSARLVRTQPDEIIDHPLSHAFGARFLHA